MTYPITSRLHRLTIGFCAQFKMLVKAVYVVHFDLQGRPFSMSLLTHTPMELLALGHSSGRLCLPLCTKTERFRKAFVLINSVMVSGFYGLFYYGFLLVLKCFDFT